MLDELAMLGGGPHKGFVDYYINLTDAQIKNLSLTTENFDLCT